MEHEKDKVLNDNLKTIMDHFGINNQLRKFNEECFELIEAIVQSEYPALVKDKKPDDLKRIEKAHIAEEIADCMVLLNQFMNYYDIGSLRIQRLFEEKIFRTIHRIENNYYKVKE